MKQDTPALSAPLDVAVVGAGFAGLHSISLLRKAGLQAHVFEAGRRRDAYETMTTSPGAVP